MTDWNKLKVVDLRNELKKRGLPLTGLKLDLVERLTLAENEAGSESEATVQGDAGKDAASTSPETLEPASSSFASPPEPLQHHPNPDHEQPKTSPQVITPTPPTTRPASTVENPQTTLPPEDTSTSLPPVEPEEAIEDRQKRKRRSPTPPPSATDIARKRARQSSEPVHFQNDLTTTKEDADWVENHNGVNAGEVNTEVKVTSSGVQLDHTTGDSMDGIEVESVRPKYEMSESPTRTRNSRYGDLVQAPQSSRDEVSQGMDIDVEPDRDISPAIHPATSALYIRDLMRPLNQIVLKEYLTKLASPPGQAPEPDVIVSFYLDPIRTHCFVSFSSVSAASRVRSAIHDRIWPDESNRKPLWADFIPSEKVDEWIAEEKAFANGGRSSMKKWEVYYDTDEDRRVTVVLQEANGRPLPTQTRRPSMQIKGVSQAPQASQDSRVPVHPDRLAFVPGASPPASGPAVHPDRLSFVPGATPPAGPQSYRGMEGIPSGPRAQNREQRAAQNISQLDDLFRSTSAKPKLYWQPASKSLANARLDKMEDAATKDISRHVGGDINRYTFEDGDILVDRGPEIFPGIRPPPRGERRERGPPPFRGGGDRGRGGYGGYRGRGGYEGRAGYDSRAGYEGRGYEGRGYEGRRGYDDRRNYESRGRFDDGPPNEPRGGYDRGYDSYTRGQGDSRDSRDRRY